MSKSERGARQIRSLPTEFRAEEKDGAKYIEGYFAVFNSVYELWPGATESVAEGAFSGTLGEDVRALINHDTTLVLGRNKAGTLELTADTRGLWGQAKINEDDQDAMNLYARVKRGDVDQCSFGFDILSEETDLKPDGSVHWTIKSVKLYEVSVVTFPAYQETSVSARKDEYRQIKTRQLDEWKEKTKGRLKKC